MMRGGNATIGTWLQFPSADVAEVMGASGYDWVAVDMEHGAFTRAILPDVFRAIERGGSTPFARIAQAELRPIKDALDSGASDFEADGSALEITTDPDAFNDVVKALEAKGYTFVNADIEMVPQNYVTLTSEGDVHNMERLIDFLEDNDDVQNVWHNWDND